MKSIPKKIINQLQNEDKEAYNTNKELLYDTE